MGERRERYWYGPVVILFRYFAKEVFLTTFSTAGIVLVISLGWRFSGYLEEAAAGEMTREVLLALLLYKLPGFLELILPVSFFLAIILVYGRLYVDSEMVVLESCGMSPGRIIGITLILALMMMALTAMLTLWLKPLGEQSVEDLFRSQKNLTEFDTLVPGRFEILGGGRRVTYTEEISRNGKLGNVFINEFRGEQMTSGPSDTVTVIADSGETIVDEAGNRFLVLKNGTRYRGQPGQNNYQVVTYEEYGQLVENKSPSLTKPRRTAIPTATLFTRDDPMVRSELHWRIGVILLVPIIALMAIPLSKVNPRQGRYSRLVPAMILCFVYILVLSAGSSGLERGDLPAKYGLWWVHAIFVLITLGLYRVEWFTSLLEE